MLKKFLIFIMVIILLGTATPTLAAGYACRCPDKTDKTKMVCKAQEADCPTKNCCLEGCIMVKPPCPANEVPSVAATNNLGTGFVSGTTNQIIKLENPLCLDATCSDAAGSNMFIILGTLIKGALSIMGGLVLLMLVWGGFQWLTSAGNPEKVKKGTDTMLWAVVGTVLVLSSYLVVSTFLNYLAGKK